MSLFMHWLIHETLFWTNNSYRSLFCYEIFTTVTLLLGAVRSHDSYISYLFFVASLASIIIFALCFGFRNSDSRAVSSTCLRLLKQFAKQGKIRCRLCSKDVAVSNKHNGARCGNNILNEFVHALTYSWNFILNKQQLQIFVLLRIFTTVTLLLGAVRSHDSYISYLFFVASLLKLIIIFALCFGFQVFGFENGIIPIANACWNNSVNRAKYGAACAPKDVAIMRLIMRRQFTWRSRCIHASNARKRALLSTE